jgi:hypothetical protein
LFASERRSEARDTHLPLARGSCGACETKWYGPPSRRYSSDHGFQLGEFNLLIDKRQMYGAAVFFGRIISAPCSLRNLWTRGSTSSFAVPPRLSRYQLVFRGTSSSFAVPPRLLPRLRGPDTSKEQQSKLINQCCRCYVQSENEWSCARYDHDTRIHLLARGPGIAAGSLFPYLGTQVRVLLLPCRPT